VWLPYLPIDIPIQFNSTCSNILSKCLVLSSKNTPNRLKMPLGNNRTLNMIGSGNSDQLIVYIGIVLHAIACKNFSTSLINGVDDGRLSVGSRTQQTSFMSVEHYRNSLLSMHTTQHNDEALRTLGGYRPI